MKNLYIHSGPIKTGKTTALFKFIMKQKNADGILQPVINDTRCFFLIREKRIISLESPSSVKNDLISIGKYSFLKSSFDYADKYMLDAFNSQPDFLIFDEIGPLELEGRGMRKSLDYIMQNRLSFNGSIIFVVRDSLLDPFVKLFQLEQEYKPFQI